MKDRNTRDSERRNYIKEKIRENLECVEDDPQSLFSESIDKIS